MHTLLKYIINCRKKLFAANNMQAVTYVANYYYDFQRDNSRQNRMANIYFENLRT